MFIQNVALLCFSMIVLGAVIGYVTPHIRKWFFRNVFDRSGFDFAGLEPTGSESTGSEPISSESTSSDSTGLEPTGSDSKGLDFEGLESEKLDVDVRESRQQSYHKSDDSEELNQLKQLVQHREVELGHYRANVKQHFVDMAKVLNNKHESDEALNQAMISQIGLGAEKLVGAESMKSAVGLSLGLSASDLGSNSFSVSEGYVEGASAKANDKVNAKVNAKANASDKAEWIPVEQEAEIDEFFVETSSETNHDAEAKKENRFQELAEEIEGKSNNAFSGIKNWFSGVTGTTPRIATPNLGRTTSTNSTNLSNDATKKTYSDLLVTSIPQTDVHYDNGVLVDDSVLDSQWSLDSTALSQHDRTQQVSSKKPDGKTIKASKSIGSERDYRSAYVYSEANAESDAYEQSSSPSSIDKDTQPNTNKVSANDEASQYLRLQQGFDEKSAGSESSKFISVTSDDTSSSDISLETVEKPLEVERPDPYVPERSMSKVAMFKTEHDSEASQIDKISSVDVKTDVKADVESLESKSDMLDPYDRITDAVLKESSKQNLNDEKKIIHELFYVRGHQSNISGKAMSNINPGIPKDN